MDGVKSGVDQLREIFDLCDSDRDGVITAEDFRLIGLEHFGKTQPLELLINGMDPDSSGHITFSMFCQGVESFLVERQRLSSRSSRCSTSPYTDITVGTGEEPSSPGGYDSAFSSGDIYPADRHNSTSCLSNGYDSIDNSTGHSTVELVVDPDDGEEDGSPLYQSSPVAAIRPATDSPSTVARTLMRRHNHLSLPNTPSHGNTPAEYTDEEVSKLSDQLLDLSVRLEDLQEDHRGSQGVKQRLKKENEELKRRLEEYEELLNQTELSSQEVLSASQDTLKRSVEKVRRESRVELEDLTTQLRKSLEQVSRLQDSELSLRNQLALAQEESKEREEELEEAEESRRRVEEELRRAREELCAEREKWEEESERYKQDIQDRDYQLHTLHKEFEDVRRDKTMDTITASDMDTEIGRLRKEVERLRQENEGLQAQFVQHGKELLSRNKHSLAAEMEHASKDEVVKALEKTEEQNSRLHGYIEGLLVSILEQHPEILEKI